MDDSDKPVRRVPFGLERRLREYVTERRDERRPFLDVVGLFHSGIGYLEKRVFSLLEEGYQEGRRLLFADGLPFGEAERPRFAVLALQGLSDEKKREALLSRLRHRDEIDAEMINNPAKLQEIAAAGISAVEAIWLLYPEIRLFGLEDAGLFEEQQRVIGTDGPGSPAFLEVAGLRSQSMFDELVSRCDEFSDRGRVPLKVMLAVTMVHFSPFNRIARLRDIRASFHAVR